MELRFASPILLERIVADALAEPGRERCGLLVGRPAAEGECSGESAVVMDFVSARNRSSSPQDSYEVDPICVLESYRKQREGGPPVLGVYHSHPGGGAVPSQRDRDQAWESLSYLIVGEDGTARSWRLVEGEFREEAVVVEEEQPVESRRERPESALLDYLVPAYLIAAGLFFLFYPWTDAWESNRWVQWIGWGGSASFPSLLARLFLNIFGGQHLVLAIEYFWDRR